MVEGTSILDVNLDNIPQFELADDGDEIRVRVVTHDVVPIKSSDDPNAKQISVRLEPTDNEMMDDIYAYVPIPNPADEARDMKRFFKACGRLRDFCDCFGIDHSTGVNLDEVNGSEGYIIAGKETTPDGSERNRVKQWVKQK